MLIINELIGFGAGGPEWTTIYSGSLNTDNTGVAGYSLRALIPLSGLSGAKTSVQVSILGHSSLTCTVANWAIGVPATAPNTAATPVELKIGGASGFSLSSGASAVSDPAALSLSGSETHLIVVFDCTNGNHKILNPSSGTEYYKAASASYNQASVSGYSNIGYIPFVTKIEAS